MTEVWMVTGMFLATFLIRYLPYGIADALRLPESLERALRYIPPAVLMAIVAPAVLIPDGQQVQLDWHNPYLIGAGVAFLVGWWRNHLLLTILSAMLAFFAWQALF